MKKVDLKFLRKLPASKMYEVRGGASINNTVQEAIELSTKTEDMLVMFIFNGVLLMIRGSESDSEAIVRDYHRATNGCIVPRIGPTASKILSGEETKNDQRILLRNKNRGPKLRSYHYPSVRVSQF